MNSISKLAVVGFLLASSTGYAVAQTAETATTTSSQDVQVADRGDDFGWGPESGHKGKHGHHGGHKMQVIDANGDGVIGEDEAAVMADRMFMRLDANADSALTEAEFTTPPHGHFWSGWFNSAEIAAVQKVRKEKFAALDADKDGKLTKAEFFADAKSKLAAADTDKDGKVSAWEFRAAN